MSKDNSKISPYKKVIDDLFLVSLVLVFLLSSLSIAGLPIVFYILAIPLFIVKMIVFKQKLKSTGVEIFIGIFLLTSFISSIASYFYMGDLGSVYMKNSLIWFYKTAPAILIFIITVQGGYKRWARILASAFLLGSVLNGIYLTSKFIYHFKDLNIYSDRFRGFIRYAIGTNLPMAFCVASWLLTEERLGKSKITNRILIWLGYIITTVSSLFTLVRNAVLGIIISTIIFIIKTKRKIFVITLIIYIILTFLIPMTRFRVIDTLSGLKYTGFFWEPSSVKEWRWRLYPIGIDIIKRYPLFGVGPRNVALIISEYRPYSVKEFQAHLHNNFLEIGAEMGLIGLSALIALFVSIYVALLKHKNNRNVITLGLSALTAFIVIGMFDYFIGVYEAFISFWEVLSIAFLYLYGREKENTDVE